VKFIKDDLMLFFEEGGDEYMTKTELIDSVADKSGLTKKDSGKAIDAVINAMTQALSKGEKVQLVGFGSFEVRKREARKGRNPQTGAEIKIAARKVPVFKAGKALKDAVGKK
jgi:DNA-binding protein HU-beta